MRLSIKIFVSHLATERIDMLYKQGRKVNETSLRGKPCGLSGVLPGLSPIVPHRSSGKEHDSREREGKRIGNMKKGHLGVFHSHNTTVQHHWHGSNL